jgi:hypothetical protein
MHQAQRDGLAISNTWRRAPRMVLNDVIVDQVLHMCEEFCFLSTPSSKLEEISQPRPKLDEDLPTFYS